MKYFKELNASLCFPDSAVGASDHHQGIDHFTATAARKRSSAPGELN